MEWISQRVVMLLKQAFECYAMVKQLLKIISWYISVADMMLFCGFRDGGLPDRHNGHIPRHDPQVCDRGGVR